MLTQVANFWFDKLAHVVPGQLTGVDPNRSWRRMNAIRCVAAPLSSAPASAADRGGGAAT